MDAKQNAKNKIAAAVDFFKTVMIYLLTVSMLTAAGFYINARQNAGQLPPEIPGEKMRLFESRGIVLAETDANHINPIQITITAENNSFTALYNDIVLDIYENFKHSVRDIFSRNSVCIRQGKEEGEKLWTECAESENSVYIRYAGDYLYPVIYTFLEDLEDPGGNAWTGENAPDAFSGQLAMVHEFFIVGKDPVFGVSKDTNGNIAIFMPGEQTADNIRSAVNTASLRSAYNNIAGVIPCEFLKDRDISAQTGVNRNNIQNLKFPGSFHLLHNYNTYSSVLRVSNPLLDENGAIDTGQSFINELFKLLNFNIESAGSYPGANGIMFRDGKNTVNFYNGGLIEYSASDANIDGAGGIHLSKFLWYDADYTFYEKIKAASVFAGSLASELTGNESVLYLKSITADSDENLSLTFVYYYEGIQIKIDGNDAGVFIKINRDSITEARINSLGVSPHSMIKNRNPILELSVIDGMISRDISDGAGSVGDTEETGAEEIIEEIARKYKLMYDKIHDKFIVNAFELVYNINYTHSNDNEGGGDNSVTAAWEIR